MVVVLGEAVGLIADVLEESQGERVPREANRVALARKEQLFVLLGKREERRGLEALVAEGGQGGIELPLATVDQQDVGENLVFFRQLAVASGDDLMDAAVVVDPLDAQDFVAAIAR